jgi:hypothetical protein
MTHSLLSRRNIRYQGLASALLFAVSTAFISATEAPLSVTSVTASANDGNVPANTLDGNLATRWSAQGDGQWILYDLGSSKIVQSVAIAWHQGNVRTFKFDIRASADGTNWTVVYTGSSGGKSLALETYDVIDTAARYVSIVGHGNSVNAWNSITETSILGTLPATTPTTDETLLDVAAVSASANDGNVPANTLDGSLATRWSAQGDGQWILFDLGASQTVKSVDIAWHQGNTRVSKFDIRTSADGSAWTLVHSGLSSGKTLALETYDVADTTARYVSIIGHGNTVNAWNSITEVELYGAATTTVTVTNTLPPATVTLPCDVLNLTNWKLTLPVNTSHAGSPDEYLQPELAGFQSAEFFHLNTNKCGVVFKANCGGATTSGSGYPRSELREMCNNGLTEASWSTTSGTHTMIITQAITHLPVVKPHVVAGQIHNASDDVIVFRLEGQTLFVDENGKTGPVLTNQYNLGDIFTVAFVVRNGAVECYYNGKYIYSYPSKQTGCYFKAGVYTQSNCTKGDVASAYGEVTIYGLSVTHQ